MRKAIITCFTALVIVSCSACGSVDDEASSTIEAGSEETSAEVTDEAQNNEGDEAIWSLEGNFKDDSDNYIIITHTSVEDGYDKDGWDATVIFGETIYGGALEAQADQLKGTVIAYNDDGTPGEEMEITLTDDNGQVVMQSGDGKEYHFTLDETDYSSMASGDTLPFFQYNQLYGMDGFDSKEAAAYDYLSFDKEKDYEPDHVMIPYVNIVGIDETDPENVLLYGDYYVWEFAKEGDILVAVSGGHCPGIIHMKRNGEGETAIYEAESLEEALTDDDVETIFGDYYDKYHSVSSDQEIRNAGFDKVIADYVKANNLDVTKYQLDGDEPRDIQ